MLGQISFGDLGQNYSGGNTEPIHGNGAVNGVHPDVLYRSGLPGNLALDSALRWRR